MRGSVVLQQDGFLIPDGRGDGLHILGHGLFGHVFPDGFKVIDRHEFTAESLLERIGVVQGFQQAVQDVGLLFREVHHLGEVSVFVLQVGKAPDVAVGILDGKAGALESLDIAVHGTA